MTPHHANGERRLLSAIILDAVNRVLQGAADPRRRNARDVIEARAWLASDDVLEPTAFLCLTELLDLEPQVIRDALAETIRAVPARFPDAPGRQPSLACVRRRAAG